MKKKVECDYCGSDKHYSTFCFLRKKKRPKKFSDRELDYQEWKEAVARPAVIARDGDICQCCSQVHYPHDLDHIKNKGSHPELKRDINNLQLLGRFPCHRNKTDHKPCLH